MRPPSTLTHAGGLVWRVERGEHRLLLVRATTAPPDWVFPKGHIESGETPVQAGLREVQEEAGVEALAGPYLGLLEFVSPRGEHVRAGFFLMEFVRFVPSDESRETAWHPALDTLRLVRFENARKLIESALRKLGIRQTDRLEKKS